MGCGCSTAVEHTPVEQSSWGCGLEARVLGFFFFYLFLISFASGVSLIRSLKKGGPSKTVFCERTIIRKWMPSWAARGEKGSINSDWAKKIILAYSHLLLSIGWLKNFRRWLSGREVWSICDSKVLFRAIERARVWTLDLGEMFFIKISSTWSKVHFNTVVNHC